MEIEKQIRSISMLLAFVAGFCDTVTFIAAGELFSAHVTGNFIIFAYDLIKHTNAEGWQRIITFPVFILSVMIGGKINRRSDNMFTLLKLEAILLLLSGIGAIALKNPGNVTQLPVQCIAMVIVVALAFQNTFGKLFNKATYGLTTVMTGNVTQAALDFISTMSAKPLEPGVLASLKKQLVLIIGFFLGCFTGAVIAHWIGLPAVILPGSLLLFWLLYNKLFIVKR